MSAGVAYDPDACSDRWSMALRSILLTDETIDFMQKAAGYSATADAARLLVSRLRQRPEREGPPYSIRFAEPLATTPQNCRPPCSMCDGTLLHTISLSYQESDLSSRRSLATRSRFTTIGLSRLPAAIRCAPRTVREVVRVSACL